MCFIQEGLEGHFQEGITERSPCFRVSGSFQWGPRFKEVQEESCTTCLPIFMSFFPPSSFLDGECNYICSCHSLMNSDSCSSHFQHGLKTSDTLKISQAFSTGLGLLRHPASWTEQIPGSQSFQHADSYCQTTYYGNQSKKSPFIMCIHSFHTIFSREP